VAKPCFRQKTLIFFLYFHLLNSRFQPITPGFITLQPWRLSREGERSYLPNNGSKRVTTTGGLGFDARSDHHRDSRNLLRFQPIASHGQQWASRRQSAGRQPAPRRRPE
jgi:hypothetical protein